MGWINVIAGDLDGVWKTDTGFLGSGPFKMAKPRAFRRPETVSDRGRCTSSASKAQLQPVHERPAMVRVGFRHTVECLLPVNVPSTTEGTPPPALAEVCTGLHLH